MKNLWADASTPALILCNVKDVSCLIDGKLLRFDKEISGYPDPQTVIEIKTTGRPIAKDHWPANCQVLAPASYSPRIDPVPSPSRLKRTARNEVTELVIHQNLRNLARYPFELMEDADVATNMSKKANLQGLCFEYLSQTELSGDNIRFFDPSLTTANLKADGLKNFELPEDLSALKAVSWQNAVDALLEIIEP